MLKTPEQWLEVAAPQKKQPIFKLFVGYAPGVGKTFNMLSEGIRRKSRGEDVVIGLVETHGRKAVAELADKLETVSTRRPSPAASQSQVKSHQKTAIGRRRAFGI